MSEMHVKRGISPRWEVPVDMCLSRTCPGGKSPHKGLNITNHTCRKLEVLTGNWADSLHLYVTVN